ncbi:MAG: hypothetical protein R2788_09835 [Saprospiraceae bacterium]
MTKWPSRKFIGGMPMKPPQSGWQGGRTGCAGVDLLDVPVVDDGDAVAEGHGFLTGRGSHTRWWF